VVEKDPKAKASKEKIRAVEDERTAPAADDETTVRKPDHVEEGQPKLLVIGDYALLGRIGAGGMGRVFKAQHRRMDRLVALKILSKKQMGNPDSVLRFHQEMKAAAKLIHPNIVTAFDAGEQGGIHYLVMEYVDGLSLNQVIKNHGPLPYEKAVDSILQAARGLSFSHSCGMIHRDIKPSNLIQDAEGTVKILDMGTARIGTDEPVADGLTVEGMIMGTINYMAPEQARDASKADHRSDIYSLGCTLFFLLTGRSLYKGKVVETLMAHAQKPIPSLREHCDDVPLWLEEVYTRMVAKKPEDRYQSVEEMIQDVQEWMNPQDSSESRSSLIADLPTPQSIKVMPIGIDLGTNNSAIAWVNEQGEPVVIEDAQGEWQTASIVSVDGMDTVIGARVMKQLSKRKDMPAMEIKRFLGRTYYPEPMAGNRYHPETLLGLVLAKLSYDFQRKVGPLKEVVVSTPACFDGVRRKAVQDVGFMAGLDVMGLAIEPVAATLYYGHKNPISADATEKCLVLDLGAGTLDVVAVERRGREVVVAGISGDSRLGGRDWDECVIKLVSTALRQKHGFDPLEDEKKALRLWQACEWAKHMLTERDEVTVKLQVPSGMAHIVVSRAEFEQAAAPLFKRVQTALEDLLTQIEWDKEDLDKAIFCGGASRMPMIRSLVQKIVGDLPVIQLEQNAVVQGTALYASYRLIQAAGGQPAQKVRSASCYSLGVLSHDPESGEEISVPVIPRGTSLPVTARQTFLTQSAGQVSVMVQLLEGEERLRNKCIDIGQCIIDGLPTDLPASSPIEVDLRYDENGRLTIHATIPGKNKKTMWPINREGELTSSDLHRLREWVETVMLCSSIV
jgi:molecular chaperone DnaK (HSP70)